MKFFRSFRQSELAQERFSKYLIYALGEIILVVLGILIAVQVNNWNEKRKLQNEADVLLENLKQDLLQSKAEFERNRETTAQLVENLKLIEHFMDHDLEYSDTLDRPFNHMTFWASPYFSTTTYELLKDKGIHLIRDAELREKILYLYEEQLEQLKADYDRYEWELFKHGTIPIYLKNVRQSTSGSSARPNDFDELKRNDEFRNLLSYLINVHQWGIKEYGSAVEEIDDILERL